MPRRQKTNRRTLDYLTLQWILLLFILGGLVTLNCNPTKSIAGGKLTLKNGVEKIDGGGVLFDSAVNNDFAEYVLPATMEVYYPGEEDPRDSKIDWIVDPVHKAKNRASMVGNTAKINYPEKAEQGVYFTGTYTKPDGTKGKVVHRITVARY